ncbi:MAG: TRAP transporter fused permease subunit [Acidobacteriota bacterium]
MSEDSDPARRRQSGARDLTIRDVTVRALAVALCVFTVFEVNYPHLRPQSQLAIFAGLGLALCFLVFPLHPRLRGRLVAAGDWLLAAASLAVCAYVVAQSEPALSSWWLDGRSLGDRAGAEAPLDWALGVVGLLLVLESARRTVGLALPLLSIAFLAYAHFGPSMPDWLFPHRGYDWQRVVSQTFLHSQGVFGTALKVMFTYVFLFVVFGAILEMTGATAFVIDLARRLLGSTPGGPAKVSILSSGLMGSLSGSAVANTATTGTFTIPLMRSGGFRRETAAGIEAAASSGGALVPPVMGAGAYMMLEIVSPPVTYLAIVRAALLPAILYYLALFLIAHYRAQGLSARGARGGSSEVDPDGELAARATAAETATESQGDDGDEDGDEDGDRDQPPRPIAGVLFAAGLGTLLLFLLFGFTVFRSVTVALGVVLLLSLVDRDVRPTPRRLVTALVKSARGGIALIAASACVGIVLGVVTLTGIGSKLPATLLPLAEQNLFLALLLLMVSSIVLGMGLPSAVCYLLLATLVGPALGDLGVVPLAAHLFIFYFGLMSMVTPPVALAAYTAASIAGSNILTTAFAAFRFALVGFVLPFLFVYRPQLLMLAPDGEAARPLAVVIAFALAAAGTVPLAAAIAGYFGRPLSLLQRLGLAVLAGLLFWPASGLLPTALPVAPANLLGAAALIGLVVWQRRQPR